MNSLTALQRKALVALRAGPLTRPRFSWDWITPAGGRIALGVVASLRKRGFAKIFKGRDRMTARITDAGRLAAEGTADAA